MREKGHQWGRQEAEGGGKSLAPSHISGHRTDRYKRKGLHQGKCTGRKGRNAGIFSKENQVPQQVSNSQASICHGEQAERKSKSRNITQHI